jgi:hypothetical protein
MTKTLDEAIYQASKAYEFAPNAYTYAMSG